MALSYPECVLPDPTQCARFLLRGEIIGMTIATTTGVLSTFAVLIIFCVIMANVIICKRKYPGGNWAVFRSPLDVYMASLLTSDILQGLGKVLNVRWLRDGYAECGGYCTAQGMVQQIGEAGVALATLAIAIHTFLIIFFRVGSEARTHAIIAVALIWIFVILFAVIGSQKLTDGDERYITPSPYWCWISPKHKTLQLTGEYLWIWIATLVSLVLSIPLSMRILGYLRPTGDGWLDFALEKGTNSPSVYSADTRDALLMLAYPVCYFVLVLPISICRWMGFTGHDIPTSGTFFSTSVFGLSGLVNVLLLWYTRPGLLLLTRPKT